MTDGTNKEPSIESNVVYQGRILDLRVDTIVLPSGRQTTREICLLYTSPSPRDGLLSRMPSSA